MLSAGADGPVQFAADIVLVRVHSSLPWMFTIEGVGGCGRVSALRLKPLIQIHGQVILKTLKMEDSVSLLDSQH